MEGNPVFACENAPDVAFVFAVEIEEKKVCGGEKNTLRFEKKSDDALRKNATISEEKAGNFDKKRGRKNVAREGKKADFREKFRTGNRKTNALNLRLNLYFELRHKTI